MAVGDLVGDLATAYLTPAQRAAKLGSSVKQASFDITNTPGVVGRAQQQLPPINLAALGTATAQPYGPAAQGQPKTAGLESALPGFTSLSQQAAQVAEKPASLASLSGITPTASSPTYPTASQIAGPVRTEIGNGAPGAPGMQALPSLASIGSAGMSPNNLPPMPATLAGFGATDQPPAAQPAQPAPAQSLESAYRPTGIGQGSNAIAAKVGTNSVPEFSNQPADLASAAGMAPISNTAQPQKSTGPVSLADIMPGTGAAPGSNADLASLSSARNLGDGIGTFSQANAGDSALAMGRFQKANDLRNAYQDQDRLRNAVAAQTRDKNFNVVRDSTQPITRRELQFNEDRKNTTQSLADAVTGSQSLINNRRQGLAADQQQRQALRLEDLATAAAEPNATPEAQSRLFAAADPKGYAQTQREAPLKALEIQNKQLDNARIQQQIDIGKTTQDQTAKDRQTAIAGQVASVDQALSSVNGILGVKNDAKKPGSANSDEDKGLTNAVGLVSVLPTRPGSDAANFEARNEVLKAQTFLPQVSLLKGMGALSNTEGEKLTASIASLSTKQSPEAYRKSLGIVRDTFNATKARLNSGTLIPVGSNQEFEKPLTFGEQPKAVASSKPSSGAAPGTLTASAAALPTITSKAQADALPAGSLFIGPDGKQYRK